MKYLSATICFSLLSVLLLNACSEEPTVVQDTLQEITTAATGTRISINLDWRNRTNQWPAQIVNNLGYTIQLEMAYVVNLYLELKPCNPKDLQPFIQMPAQSKFSIISRAYAVHPMSAPSRIVLDAPEWVDLSPTEENVVLDIPPISYCSVHFLMARATENTLTHYARAYQDNISMSVRGKYQAPGSAEWQDFEISTSVA
ncbi:MAG: hypothetical protein AAF512_23080, partial [Pseudomonadota bacterium]